MNTPSKASRWLRNGKYHPGLQQLAGGVYSHSPGRSMIMAPIWRRVWPVTIHLTLVYKRVCLLDRVRRLVYISSYLPHFPVAHYPS